MSQVRLRKNILPGLFIYVIFNAMNVYIDLNLVCLTIYNVNGALCHRLMLFVVRGHYLQRHDCVTEVTHVVIIDI